MVYYRNGLPMRNANVLTVFGEGKVHVEPNLAFITIGIVRENKNLQTAQAENSVASNNVIQALLALGINPNHIRSWNTGLTMYMILSMESRFFVPMKSGIYWKFGSKTLVKSGLLSIHRWHKGQILFLIFALIHRIGRQNIMRL